MQNVRHLTFVFLAVALAGFLDATYLTAEHFIGSVPPCFVASGCETVLTSEWSVIYGVPLALIGAIFYLSLLILAIFYLRSRPENNCKEKVIRTAIYGSSAGFLASLLFVFLQLFVIKEICFYCMISACTSTALFVTGILIYLKLNKKPTTDSLQVK